MRSVYFDYNATTPLDPTVREAMLPLFDELYGNPSSIHHIGRKARAALDEARDRVATVWKAKPSEVIFTSGGTESNNLAILGSARFHRDKGRHLICSPVEHHSVFHSFEYLAKKEGFEVTWLKVDADGVIDLDHLATAIRPETVLVSVMGANNETGTIQPIAEAGTICQKRGVLFHTDASQWFGKLPFSTISQFNADFVTFCAHKLHGPKGTGALYIKSPNLPDPIIMGGGHENERRAGTENLAAIVGLTVTMENAVHVPIFPKEKLEMLTTELFKLEEIPGVVQRGSRATRLPNTVSFTVEGCDSIALLAGLDIEGLCASSGSACTAGSLEPSHVLKAMGLPKNLANSFVRFSLGRESTAAEVAYLLEIFPSVVNRIRGA